MTARAHPPKLANEREWPTATRADCFLPASSLADADRAYQAPDVRSPAPDDGRIVDDRADVYASGCLAYATAFVTPPRRGQRAVAFPAGNAHAGAAFSDSLARVVRSALAWDVHDRPRMAALLPECRAPQVF